jgi:hypothetical protein
MSNMPRGGTQSIGGMMNPYGPNPTDYYSN